MKMIFVLIKLFEIFLPFIKVFDNLYTIVPIATLPQGMWKPPEVLRDVKTDQGVVSG